ncbi:MAG: ATP-dependent Clp protease ATP-binding subunit [Bacilli bacterium]|nr:ATP-dependent Clp protease ATP-binding subunit [Bacilli bacterium]
MFSTFTNELKKHLYNAKKEMNELKHSYIGSEHFILAVLKDSNNLSRILNNYGITYDRFRKSVIDLVGIGNSNESLFIYTPLFKKVLEDAIQIAKNNNLDVSMENVFLSIMDEAEGVAYRIFCDYLIDIDSLYDEVDDLNVSFIPKNRYIDEVGIDLCKKAINDDVDPVIGREKETDRLIEIICRRTKRNPLLIGEAGVGKTSIVEEFARRLAFKEVPQKLQNKRVVSISMASLVAGTKYRGEFEEKVLKIFDDLEKSDDVIVFIDEIHTLVGAGGADGAIDASNILKPALARGKVIVIGATTTKEYNKYIEDDKALSRRFQTIMVEEPKEKELFNILNKLKTKYEEYHNVSISTSILKYIIKLSKIYLPYRKEPDKSIDILDEACSKISIGKDKETIKKSNYLKRIAKINIMKSNMLMLNKYAELIKLRNEERKLLSNINKIDLKIMTNNRRKKLTKESIDDVISLRSNITLYNSLNTKSVLSTLKKELKARFTGQNDAINKLIEQTKEYININKHDKLLYFTFNGNDCEYMNSFAKLYGKILLDDRTTVIDLESYRSIDTFIMNNKSLIENLKEYPQSLLIFNNLDNAIYDIKDYINKIIKDGKIELEKDTVYINHLIVINIEKKKESNLGFNNFNKIDSNTLNVIHFNKEEKEHIVI